MNKLSTAKRVALISALLEGCSVRATSRLTGVAKGTILSLLANVGEACARYQDAALRNIPAKRVHIDEIWSFVGCKEKNVTPEIASQLPKKDATMLLPFIEPWKELRRGERRQLLAFMAITLVSFAVFFVWLKH